MSHAVDLTDIRGAGVSVHSAIDSGQDIPTVHSPSD